MDYLRDLSDFIDDLPEHDPFDPVVLKLPKLEWQMTTLLRRLREQIDDFKNKQRGRQQCIMTRAPQQQSRAAADWVILRRRHRENLPIDYIAPANEYRMTDVAISRDLQIRAIEVADFAAVAVDGLLYYIPRMQRFAMRIAGFLIHGNIGQVYITESMPQKIRDCETCSSQRNPSCKYYHNPLTYPGSVDVRNFAASSWLYNRGATSGNKKARKLSSRANLDDDILTITGADLAFYNEQLMHDILCSILMNYYVKKE